VTNVDGEETAETVEILAALSVIYKGAFATVNDGQSIALHARKASEVAPQVTLSEVFNLYKVGGVHISTLGCGLVI
jgi:hypothetical protein